MFKGWICFHRRHKQAILDLGVKLVKRIDVNVFEDNGEEEYYCEMGNDTLTKIDKLFGELAVWGPEVEMTTEQIKQRFSDRFEELLKKHKPEDLEDLGSVLKEKEIHFIYINNPGRPNRIIIPWEEGELVLVVSITDELFSQWDWKIFRASNLNDLVSQGQVEELLSNMIPFQAAK